MSRVPEARMYWARMTSLSIFVAHLGLQALYLMPPSLRVYVQGEEDELVNLLLRTKDSQEVRDVVLRITVSPRCVTVVSCRELISVLEARTAKLCKRLNLKCAECFCFHLGHKSATCCASRGCKSSMQVQRKMCLMSPSLFVHFPLAEGWFDVLVMYLWFKKATSGVNFRLAFSPKPYRGFPSNPSRLRMLVRESGSRLHGSAVRLELGWRGVCE